jgi:hypothetical protein
MRSILIIIALLCASPLSASQAPVDVPSYATFYNQCLYGHDFDEPWMNTYCDCVAKGLVAHASPSAFDKVGAAATVQGNTMLYLIRQVCARKSGLLQED